MDTYSSVKERKKTMNVFEQERKSWCGVACVKMILDCYGIRYSQRRIAREMGTTKENGTSHIQIRKYLYFLGIKTFEVRGLTYEKLLRVSKNNEENPLLIHWWDSRTLPADGHYSLIICIDKKGITLADPATGEALYLTKDKFISVWKDGENDNPSGWVMIC
jgi:ABC-type bacteriocin/lantibiotic exporter with double-glycine peptidase domain